MIQYFFMLNIQNPPSKCMIGLHNMLNQTERFLRNVPLFNPLVPVDIPKAICFFFHSKWTCTNPPGPVRFSKSRFSFLRRLWSHISWRPAMPERNGNRKGKLIRKRSYPTYNQTQNLRYTNYNYKK